MGPTPYLAFYPAIIAAAAFGGLGPGLLATILTVLCVDLLFTQPLGQLSRDPLEWARQALFLAGGVGISLVAGMRSAAEQRRQRKEQELQESQEKYRVLAEHTRDWEFWLAPDGRFLYISPSCQNVTGYPAEAFLADPHLADRIVHPEDQELL